MLVCLTKFCVFSVEVGKEFVPVDMPNQIKVSAQIGLAHQIEEILEIVPPSLCLPTEEIDPLLGRNSFVHDSAVTPFVSQRRSFNVAVDQRNEGLVVVKMPVQVVLELVALYSILELAS